VISVVGDPLSSAGESFGAGDELVDERVGKGRRVDGAGKELLDGYAEQAE
jgi:hypothetical protein